jgi:hypothetical protein
MSRVFVFPFNVCFFGLGFEQFRAQLFNLSFQVVDILLEHLSAADDQDFFPFQNANVVFCF